MPRDVSHGFYAVDLFKKRIDKRTQKGKILTQIFREGEKYREKLISHVGGSPTVTEEIIIDDLVSLQTMALLYDFRLLTDQNTGSRDRRLALSNSMRLHCQTLGLKAKMKDITPLSERLAALASRSAKKEGDNGQG